ncbi:MAG TPA: PEP-utilizing enzyme [Dissulfurispiraceae bacterium]|nr:PEP-utilizing enzyme [Dissulfurispiraceae bacterium]
MQSHTVDDEDRLVPALADSAILALARHGLAIEQHYGQAMDIEWALNQTIAAIMGGLAGIVAETGSVTSHLAAVAREYGVPMIVYPSACL